MVKKHQPICFDWDKANKDKNKIKHKVDHQEAEQVFFNHPLKNFIDIKHSQKELRFYSLGKTDKNRYLTIIYTVRNKKIRIISARDQSRNERKIYEN